MPKGRRTKSHSATRFEKEQHNKQTKAFSTDFRKKWCGKLYSGTVACDNAGHENTNDEDEARTEIKLKYA